MAPLRDTARRPMALTWQGAGTEEVGETMGLGLALGSGDPGPTGGKW